MSRVFYLLEATGMCVFLGSNFVLVSHQLQEPSETWELGRATNKTMLHFIAVAVSRMI